SGKKPRKDKKQCPCTIKLGGKKRQGDRLLKKAGSKPKEDECVDLQLHSVRFLDDLTIHKDMVGRADPITGAEWENSSIKQFKNEPVGYAGGTQMRVEVKFKPIRPPKEKTVTGVIKGVTTVKKKDGSKIDIELLMKPGEKVTLPKGSTSLIGPVVLRAKNNQKDIDWEKMTPFYDKMEIDWKFAPTTTPKDADFKRVDSSEHKVYVTLDKPENKEGELYLTLLHLATSVPGAKTRPEAVENTWSRFANPTGEDDLTTWDNRKLYYYDKGKGMADCIAHGVGSFLTSSDGNGGCNAFAELFMEALLVNGIPEDAFRRINIRFPDHDKDDMVMMINNWETKSGKPPRLSNRLILERIFSSMVPVPDETDDNNNPVYGDFVSLPGIAGQNTRTPSEKAFHKHWIVKVLFDKFQQKPYYDPSYGKTYTKDDFVENTLYGFAKHLSEDMLGVYRYQRKIPSGNPILFIESRFSAPIPHGDAD
ncbi:MAG: hypothetical protein DRR19_32965, partial [Candidatus Parabeggiatoa sp. nov. 1]